MRRRPGRLLGAGSVLLLGLAGCGDGGAGTQREWQSSASGDITVFAAASLTEAFKEIEQAFEEANPGADLQFNFAGSSTLSRQINQGAPADVFASASPKQMQKVVDADNAGGDPTVFVANKLQIVVPEGNPANVTGLADLGKQELDIALCAEEVPCGDLSQTVFEAAGITPSPDTLEQDVKAVLTKVTLGETDAGLVYRTDVAAADEAEVDGIDLPAAVEAVNEYPIVTLAEAPNAETGQAFVDYVLSDEGKAVLEDYGFGTDVG
ncbi:MAG: molybdate ABC transporter substrate-binding protein [Pseudonocardiaceae bacterium]|nr:molybdate ABC transporter substrate-binding protein [Pseudonocardiaceae bacterium]